MDTDPGVDIHPKLKKENNSVDAYDIKHGEHNHIEWVDLTRIGFVALGIVASWLGLWKGFTSFDVISLVATLIGGYPIFREAIASLISRRMTMELSMTIALGAALAIGEFFTALVIVLFVLIAEVLENLTVSRGRGAIKDLLELLPQSATIRREGQVQEVRTTEIQAGDSVIIKPGSRIPVDGVVIRGNSFVDQSTITGESMPVEKVKGSQVYAGTINQSGLLEVRPVKLGRDTAFGKVIQAVEQAEKSRAPIQKTADRLAGYLVYFAIICAALTFLVTRDMRSTISVIIVAGACGIAAGTPLAILGAIGRAARNGTIVKGGLYMEILSVIDTVPLDKTGTLTFGNPEVTNVYPRNGATTQAVLEAAAIAERCSEHILGKAILKKASEISLSIAEPERFEYIPGKGIICSLNGEEIIVGNRSLFVEKHFDIDEFAGTSDHLSEVLVARDGQFLGTLQISDVLRPEAVEAVRMLREMGIRTILLTGDSKAIAHAVGNELGVDEIFAELLPDQKLNKVKSLILEGKKVAMVGDGINDAPALMQASVGVAIGSGTDIARESSNVLLIGNDLLKFVEVLRIARQCHRIIMTNFAGTLLVDGVGVGLAAFGLLSPLLAAFIHVFSELVFILNSARMLPRKCVGSGVNK
ncbi:MAG: cation-translocating P-type ATPase [Thermodesulfobacteriota bacterium]